MTSRLHHVTSDDDVITTSTTDAATSGGGASPSVLKTSGRQAAANPLYIGYVTAALVLGFMCLVLGLVYGYIHFTRISPRFRAARLFDHAGRADARNASTHIFLRNSKSMQALWSLNVAGSYKGYIEVKWFNAVRPTVDQRQKLLAYVCHDEYRQCKTTPMSEWLAAWLGLVRLQTIWTRFLSTETAAAADGACVWRVWLMFGRLTCWSFHMHGHQPTEIVLWQLWVLYSRIYHLRLAVYGLSWSTGCLPTQLEELAIK